jgi:hypothetical protein
MALFDWANRGNEKDQWKIKKFCQVEGKVNTNRRPFSSINPQVSKELDKDNNP